MKSFRFKLQRVLELRASRLAEEERKLGVLQREIGELDTAIGRVQKLLESCNRNVASRERVNGEELKVLSSFRSRLDRDHANVTEKRREVAERIARQQESYLAARRQHRIIEKLRAERFTEWFHSTNRELDKLASELFLARWRRDRDSPARSPVNGTRNGGSSGDRRSSG